MAIKFDAGSKWKWNFNGKKFYDPRLVFDPKATAANAAAAYQRAGDNAYGNAGKAAEQGLDLAKLGADAIGASGMNPAVDQSMDRMNKNYEFATDISRSMLPIADEVGRYGDILNTDAATLQRYGDTMWGQGKTLWGQGQGIMQQGQNLIDMNPAAGGLVGEYVNWLKTIDPDRYVAMAGSDVQNSFANTQGQLNRSLTRAGADASSTNTAAMQQQLNQSLAAALAGAKTRARMQGLEHMGAALQDALGQAKSMLELGGNVSKTGADVQSSAGAMQAQAGGLHEAAGDMVAKSGDIRYKAGDLAVEAGKLASSMGNMSLDRANALVNAYGNAADAAANLARVKMDMGNYYASVAQGYGATAQSRRASRNLMGRRFGEFEKRFKNGASW